MLGYVEGVIGCKVYFPDEYTAMFVSDFRVVNNVVYRDRHNIEVDSEDWSSLHLTQKKDADNSDEDTDRSNDGMDTDMLTKTHKHSVGDGHGRRGQLNFLY